MNNNQWWSEEAELFGRFYMEGDDSEEGNLAGKKKSLVQRTNEEVDGIIRLAGLTKMDKILDCPCGYGRHSIGLASQGFTVTGIDINSFQLDYAQEEVIKQGLNSIVFLKENMIDLKYHLKFNVIINMMLSFGFFDLEEENIEVLKNFYQALEEGGRFLMHTDINISQILSGKYKKNRELRRLKNRKTLEITEHYDQSSKRLNGRWIISDIDNKQKVEKVYSHRIYTADEFIELCKLVGFNNYKVYSNWLGEPYSENSENMIVIVSK